MSAEVVNAPSSSEDGSPKKWTNVVFYIYIFMILLRTAMAFVAIFFIESYLGMFGASTKGTSVAEAPAIGGAAVGIFMGITFILIALWQMFIIWLLTYDRWRRDGRKWPVIVVGISTIGLIFNYAHSAIGGFYNEILPLLLEVLVLWYCWNVYKDPYKHGFVPRDK